METVRAFIAIDVGDEIREKLDELQRKLKKVHADVRWVKPGNMHLTLAFIGKLPVAKIEPLETALDSAFHAFKSFELAARGTGFFGRRAQPRIIWAGIADCPPLLDIQRSAVAAIQATGIEFDNKPYSPHLTLGRVRAPNHTESLLGKVEKYMHTELGSTQVAAVELMKSALTPRGAEYTVLHQTKLV